MTYEHFKTRAEAIEACCAKVCCTCGVSIGEEDDWAAAGWVAVADGLISPSQIEHCDKCAQENNVVYR
jgi:hypothetical protein